MHWNIRGYTSTWDSENCPVVWSQVSLAGRAKNEIVFSWESDLKEKVFDGADYLDNHVMWPALNARFIFTQDKSKMRWRSWKHTARDYSVKSGFRNYSIYRRPTPSVSGKSHDPLFLETHTLKPKTCTKNKTNLTILALNDTEIDTPLNKTQTLCPEDIFCTTWSSPAI